LEVASLIPQSSFSKIDVSLFDRQKLGGYFKSNTRYIDRYPFNVHLRILRDSAFCFFQRYTS